MEMVRVDSECILKVERVADGLGEGCKIKKRVKAMLRFSPGTWEELTERHI